MGEYRYIGDAALQARAREALKAGVVVSRAALAPKVMAEIPVDERDLVDSTDISKPVRGGNIVRGRIEVGKGLDYAVIVHEKPEIHHPNGGRAKYLEVPLIEHALAHLKFVRAAWAKAF